MLLPAAFHNAVQPTDNVDSSTNEKGDHDILSISHGVRKLPPVYCPNKLMAVYSGCHYLAFQSVLSLRPDHTVITIFTFLVYLCYLWFQLVSHKNLYDENDSDVNQSIEYPPSIASTKRYHFSERKIPPCLSSHPLADDVSDATQRDACSLEAGPGENDEEVEEPEMDLWTTIALLAIVTPVCRLFISLPVWGRLIVPNSSLRSPLSSSSILSTALPRVATLAGSLLASSYCQT